jgi:UDP-glucose 4-epimerase
LVYGAGVRANMYNLVKLVDRFPLLPLGGIRNCRSVAYVGNLIALLQHIIKIQASGVFIAGDQSPISTTEIIRLIAKSMNKQVYLIKIPNFLVKLISVIKPAIVDRLFGSLELENSSTNQKLGFVPPYPSEYGISEMVKWFKNKAVKV